MADTELKPCPFCGGKMISRYYNAYSSDSSFHYIGCESCDCALIDTEWSAPDFVAHANRRTTPTVSDMRDAEGHKRGVEAAVDAMRYLSHPQKRWSDEDASSVIAAYFEASGAVLCEQPSGYLFEMYYAGSDRWSGRMFSERIDSLPAEHVRNVEPLYARSPSTSQTSEA